MPQPKQGLFKRIFGRGKRGGEHESFSSFAQYAPPERVPEDAGQNIVILNSLTHGQLMELLKAHQQPEAGSKGMWSGNALPPATTGRVPGLPRAPLTQTNLNTPPPFASSSTSPAPSSASTTTGELSTLRQMMEVPNEPGLSPNNGLENALLSDQSMASNPRKGQAKRSGAKTTSHDGKAGHVMTHVCHCVLQED
ncbi:TPA: hypothetical protein ACH3X2_010216 [Trebouxia sp. C0005]